MTKKSESLLTGKNPVKTFSPGKRPEQPTDMIIHCCTIQLALPTPYITAKSWRFNIIYQTFKELHQRCVQHIQPFRTS